MMHVGKTIDDEKRVSENVISLIRGGTGTPEIHYLALFLLSGMCESRAGGRF